MSLLKLAIDAHKLGNLAVASELYNKQLKLNPQDENANQLLGMVYFASGNFEYATHYMEKSLALNPNQPHVLNNLAACFSKAGQKDAAIDCYEKAIALQPTYVEAYRNLAISQKALGKHKSALKTVASALEVETSNTELIMLQGQLYKGNKAFVEAIRCFERVLDIQPGHVEARHNLGVSLRLSGRSEQALENYLILSKQGVEKYQLAHNIANAYSDLGELEKAISYFEKAIGLNPGYVESHKNLNDLLWEMDDRVRFLASYQKALKQEGNNPELYFAYINTVLRVSMWQQAEKLLNQADESLKSYPEYYSLLGRALVGQEKRIEALLVQERCVNFESVTAEQLLSYSRNLIETNNIDPAIVVLERVLAKDPFDQLAIAYLGDCWRLKSDPRELELNNYQEMIRPYVIKPPEEFDSIESYCEALNCYLDSLHTSVNQPLEQTLVYGTQTKGNLFNDQHPLIQHLLNQFKACVEDYNEQTKHLNNSGVGKRSVTEFELSGCFSVRLSQQGFHTSHIHPMGWLSSAFYVQLPEVMEEQEPDDHQGWIHFGEPFMNLQTELPYKRILKPRVGTLALFPSYMWHGTVPFESDETRTTVVFDVAVKN